MPEIDVMKCFPVIMFINWTMPMKPYVEKTTTKQLFD